MSNTIDIANIQKYTNDFSFISEIFNESNNREHFYNARQNFNSTDIVSNGENSTEYSYIYNALSAISEDVSTQLYSEILNYIDNVSNIDLCKVKSLQSIAKILGVSYSLFSSLDLIPIDILKIIDIFSLNPAYLVKSNKINTELQQYISSYICVQPPHSSSDESVFEWPNIIYGNNLQSIISSIIYNNLSTTLDSTYSYINAPKVYSRLSSAIILSGFQIPIDDDDYNEAAQLKLRLNIPYTFNQLTEADNIYDGKTTYDQYSTAEQQILDLEFKRREKPYNPQYLTSRYSYYIDKQFKEYYQFIEYEYIQDILNTQENTYISYDVDNSYILVNNLSTDPLLSVSTDKTSSVINWSIVENVSMKLTKMILQIREIREQLKTQAQKNYMKGTFLLLQYIIKEYIYALAKNENLSIEYSDIDVDLVEYNDITQYYNISTDISSDYNDTTLNPQYWNNSATFKMIIPYDNNNVFALPITIDGTTQFISEIDIQDFYLSTLNSKFKFNGTYGSNSQQLQHLSNFLSTIYSSAADKMYVSDINGKTIINYTDNNGQLQQISLTGELTNIFEQYKRDVFLQYSGYSQAYTPFYYIINTKHPSYELHPYIKNFVEKLKDQYPIQNIANFIDNSLSDEIVKHIDSYLDDSGYIISAWNIYTNSNTDYLSRYELQSNQNKLNQTDPVVNYSGLFYPTAISELLQNSRQFYNTLSSQQCTNRWYSGLNLTREERINIVSVLNSSYTILNDIATNNKYDIFKYTEDLYGNQYFLVKEYTPENPTMFDKKTTEGTLLIKPKNFPIAMPVDKFIDTDATRSNTTISADKIYDIESYATNPQYLLLQSRKDSANIDITVKISKIFDIQQNRTKYYFDYITSKDIFGNIDTSGINSISCASDYTHIKYITIDDTFMSIYAKINNTHNIDMFVQTFQPDSYNTINNITASLNIPANNINHMSSICFDITSRGLMTIAYLSAYTISNCKNYLGEVYSPSNVLGYEPFDNLIVTHDFNISKYSITPVKSHLSTQYYNTHSEMGFIPIVVGKQNNIAQTIISEEQPVQKIQIFGANAGTNGIDFKFTAPLRAYINSTADLNYSDLEYFAYDTISLRAISNLTCSTDAPIDIKRTLSAIYLPLKADEGYIEDILNPYPNKLTPSDDYITKDNISSKNSHINVTSNVAKFKIFKILQYSNLHNIMFGSLTSNTQGLTDTLNIDDISVQWYENADGSIKLDFNSWYAKHCDDISSLDNTRNKYHLFLNLDKPGNAGYLNVYSKHNNKAEQVQCYYIKNISDSQPKFMISAEINNTNDDFENNMCILSAYQGAIAFDQPNLLEYVKVCIN